MIRKTTGCCLLAMGMILAGRHAFAEPESLTYLNTVLDGTGIVLPDNPARYPLYESLAAKLHEFSGAIAEGASLTDWYQLEDSVLADFSDMTDQLYRLILERSPEAGLSDEQLAAVDEDIWALGARAYDILVTAEFAGHKLFTGETLDAISESFKSLPEFSDLNALNTFQALIAAERSYLQSRLESFSPDDSFVTIEQDMLVVNLMLIKDQPSDE